MRNTPPLARTLSPLTSPTLSSVSSSSSDTMSYTSNRRGGTSRTPRTPPTARNPSVEPATPTRTNRGQTRVAQTPNRTTRSAFMRTTVTTEVFAPTQDAEDAPLVPQGSNVIIGAQNALSALALSPVIKVYHVPNPSELGVLSSSRAYYVITRGEQVGIVKIWSECHARIDRVDGAIYQKTESWADAFAIYSLAYDDGTIEVVPIADGVYDAPRFTIPSSNGRPGTAQVNLPHPGRRNNNITQPHEISRPRKLGAHIYAVYQGEEVGVYGSWHEVATRTRHMAGVHNFQTFDTWEDAIRGYALAHREGRLHATGKITIGQRMTLENIQFQ